MIDQFRGKYEFLSNFYRHKIRYRHRTYRTSEHAFQAAKCLRREEALRIKQAGSPGMAKKLGRTCQMRPDWDLIKVSVMREILKIKFSDPDLREKLQATGSQELVEGNYWHDTFWGVCNGQGQNMLGKLLMEIRAQSEDIKPLHTRH